MKVKTLRKIAYVLIFAMMVEAITLNININAFSKETITLEKMNENKVKALLWLKEKQKKDGSFGENLKTYYTTQLLENLEYENTFADEKIAALKYLEDIEVNSNDDLFRKYNAASKQNKYYHINMEEPKWNELQNTDGGFSLVEGYKSDILDTVLAVNGMLECDSFYGAEMNKSMEYIKRAQNNDGSFVFVDGNPNIYLTAYTYKTVNRYLEGNINSSVKNVAQQAESYLLKNEKEDKLWGVGEEKIKDTLMASIALAKNDENTLNRIALISDEIGEDGSIYSDVELTSLYVSLINEYEIACGKLDLNYVKIKDVKLCADKERIGAYTEIEVIPVIFGMKDNYEIIVTISDDDDYTTKLNKTKNNIYVWNTQNKKGTFEISIMVVDKSDMRVVASKTKQIKVYETFDVTSLTCSVSPKAYKLNCGKSIKVNTSAYVLSNINKSVTREIIVKDEEGNRLYTDAEKVNIDCKDREIMFDEFSFEPEIEKTSLLSVETNIKADDIVFDVVSDVSTMVPEVADDEEDYDENEDGTTNIINNNELNIFSHNKSEDIQEVTMDLLSGNIEMSDKETFIGDELQANVGFDNASNLDDKNVKVKVLFVNKNNQQNTYVKEQNIDVEQTKETTINIDTENLFEGDYIVILIAELNNEMTALDATGISLKEHMYKLTVNADKGGSVDITNGEYKCGELIHIVATAKDGYVFDRWVSDDIELLSNEVNSSNISISMPKKDASIKAIFAKTKKLEDKSDNYDSQDGDNCKDNNVNGNDKTDSSKININRNAVANKGVDKKANSGNKVSSVPKKERQNNVYRKHNNKNNSIGNNHKKTGTLISPLTGDFAIKDKIRIALIIQSIALIVICIALKKKDETEQKGV